MLDKTRSFKTKRAAEEWGEFIAMNYPGTLFDKVEKVEGSWYCWFYKDIPESYSW